MSEIRNSKVPGSSGAVVSAELFARQNRLPELSNAKGSVVEIDITQGAGPTNTGRAR